MIITYFTTFKNLAGLRDPFLRKIHSLRYSVTIFFIGEKRGKHAARIW